MSNKTTLFGSMGNAQQRQARKRRTFEILTSIHCINDNEFFEPVLPIELLDLSNFLNTDDALHVSIPTSTASWGLLEHLNNQPLLILFLNNITLNFI